MTSQLPVYMSRELLHGTTRAAALQGRNHGIDTGGGLNESPPPEFFFKLLVLHTHTHATRGETEDTESSGRL